MTTFLGPRGEYEFRMPTEDVVAKRFAAEQAGRLRYCHEDKAWFVWDTAMWRRDRTGRVMQRARDIARQLSTDPMGKTFQTSGRTAFVEGVERFARCDPDLAVTAEDWNDAPMLLGTPEGGIDLATGRRLDADPRLGLRRATFVAPSHDADCPRWRRFLDEACGGDALVTGFLQRFLGYALTGSTAEQIMLFVHGPGGTGKSVFLSAILYVLGELGRVAPLGLLTADTDRHAPSLAGLRGARLVVVAESERGRRWDERRLKLLTGGDMVTTGTRTWRPGFKLIVTGNQPPRLDVVDEAVRRRLCIVPFRHRPMAPDRDLEARLREEAQGILRWMIEGCLLWSREGLCRCPAVNEATGAYFADEDRIGQFIAARCIQTPGVQGSPAGALWDAWRGWAEEAGEAAGSQRSFAEALSARGHERGRTDEVRFYQGLALREAVTGETMTHDADDA